MAQDTITREELHAALDGGDDLVVIEALGPMYFDDAHLPGAINIPHTEVARLAPELVPDDDAAIVVYCANTPCPNSTIAAGELRRLGYGNVREYVEGKEDWVAAGLPTEAGPVSRQLSSQRL
jgi:rhodanese-related sulfurtransferase